MPIKKGQVLNPSGSDGGVKRLHKQLSEKLAHNVPAAVKLIEKCLKSPEFDEAKWAVDTILNRVYGKAQESLELSGPDGGPISIMSETPLTAEEFAAKFAPKAEE